MPPPGRPQHRLADGVEQGPSAQGLVVDPHRQELAGPVDGHAAVEDQAAVADQVHRAVADEVVHVLAELLARQE